VTPPGYANDGTTTTKCASGSYRANWKPYTETVQCTSCGEGVKALATDRVLVFNIMDAANQTNEAITTSNDDCCECFRCGCHMFVCLCGSRSVWCLCHDSTKVVMARSAMQLLSQHLCCSVPYQCPKQ
jgi:hypothetical protein